MTVEKNTENLRNEFLNELSEFLTKYGNSYGATAQIAAEDYGRGPKLNFYIPARVDEDGECVTDDIDLCLSRLEFEGGDAEKVIERLS